MKFTMSVNDLQQGLKTVKHGINTKDARPLQTLLNVRVTVNNSQVKLYTTNWTFSVMVSYPAITEGEGSFCVNHKELQQYVKGMNKKAMVEISVDNNQMKLSSSGMSFSLSYSSIELMPTEPEGVILYRFTIPEVTITDMDRMVPFCSTDESRPVLKCIGINDRYLVALDGYSAIQIEHDMAISSNITIPAVAVKVITSMMKSAEVEVMGAYVIITGGSVRVIAKTQLYQDYTTIFAQAQDRQYNELVINRQQLIDAVNVFRNAKLEILALVPSTADVQIISRDESINLTIDAHNSDDVVMQAFNPEFLYKLITALDTQTVTIRQSGQLSTILIKDGRHVLLLSPMRAADFFKKSA